MAMSDVVKLKDKQFEVITDKQEEVIEVASQVANYNEFVIYILIFLGLMFILRWVVLT